MSSEQKYAIQVLFGDDDWLYVTIDHPDGIIGNRLVVTYDSHAAAKEAASQWKTYRIVMFEEDNKNVS